MGHLSSSTSQHAIRIRDYSSLSALIFLFLEYASTLSTEYRYIWRARSKLVKSLFLVARYAPLASSLVNYVLVQKWLVNAPVDEESCRSWFLFLFWANLCTVAAMDGVLFLRAFALYQKHNVIYGLFIPIAAQIASACVAVLPASFRKSSFNGTCGLVSVPIIPFTIMNVSLVFTHGMLFGTAYAKRKVSKAPSSETVIRMVVNEAACIFAFFIGTITSITPVSIVAQAMDPFVVFVWPLSVHSMIACRIVLNMRSLPVEEVSTLPLERVSTEKSGRDLTVVTLSFDFDSSCG
ncbi:hypothetical protein CPC08DRAFT_712969 [Agrocybe pediades]|nr:hypothetical protein CPC08DRAFT_712969 [Agrocybe pediades]